MMLLMLMTLSGFWGFWPDVLQSNPLLSLSMTASTPSAPTNALERLDQGELGDQGELDAEAGHNQEASATGDLARCGAEGITEETQEPTPPGDAVALLRPLALRIVPTQATPGGATALKLALQGMTLPGRARRRAVALELVGTPGRRSFVVRATTPEALDHITHQLRARFPQALVTPLAPTDDPLCLRHGETVAIRELRADGPLFLSLETFEGGGSRNGGAGDGGRLPVGNPRAGGANGGVIASDPTDPLVGVLGALADIPPGVRVITQLALSPAADHWSQGVEREADRFSLYRARTEEMQAARASGGGDASGTSRGAPPLWLLALLCWLILEQALVLLWQRAASTPLSVLATSPHAGQVAGLEAGVGTGRSSPPAPTPASSPLTQSLPWRRFPVGVWRWLIVHA
ncbi:MAG TPA: hypothetical protein VNL71_19140, partial [Chloroflexota bacterium]|nr:hypothetical protein [Chloroflexota bacterium]